MNPAPLRTLVSFLRETEGSVGDRALRSGVWIAGSSGVGRLLRFVRSVILARLLVPDDFGLMGIVLFFFHGLDVLSQPGLSAAIIQRKDRIREAVDVAWAALATRGLVLTVLVAALAPWIARFYDEPRLTDLIRAVACTFAINGLNNTHTILLRKEMDFKRLAWFDVSSAVLSLVVVVGLAVVWRNVWALVAGEILRVVLGVSLSFVIVRDRPRWTYDRALLSELFRYGRYATGTTALIFLGGNLDNAVVGKVLSMQALGFYMMAYGLASMPSMNIAPLLGKVVFPAFSKLQHDLGAVRRGYLKLLRLIALLTLPTTAGIALLAPQIVSVVYGERWLPMVDALYVLCLFGALHAFAAGARPVFDALGRPHVSFWLLALRAGLIAAGLYPLTSRFGIVGAAFAVTVPALIEQALQWRVMARVLEMRLQQLLSSLLTSAVATAIMAAAVRAGAGWAAALSPLGGLVLQVAAGVVVYSTVVAVIDRELRSESRRYLRRLFAARH